MERKRALYPGRFQPFHSGHAAIVCHFWESIWAEGKSPSMMIGVVNNRKRSINNPFKGEEACRIVELSLADLDLTAYAKMELIDLPPDRRYIGKWIRESVEKHKIQILLTGNSEMADIARGVDGLLVFNPVDGSISKVRSSHIRWKIAEGKKDWRVLLTVSAGEYISNLPLNWNELPEARKRSWSY
jgi:nicotinamide mononucleotide adenylyltransferase